MTDHPDRLYAQARDAVAPFRFDEDVVRVFPDMIRRSVPGYATVVAMTGVVAARHAQAGSALYDLGCSLGASTLAMRRAVTQSGCRLVAVDNAPAMIDQARALLAAEPAGAPVELRCEDIRATPVQDASVVVLNFTLQFLPLAERATLLERLRTAMRPGGVLVLSEKVRYANAAEQRVNEALHLDFKRAQGYSELEIAQKRSALEDVLVPETPETHVARLAQAGFTDIACWFRCFNFQSFVAFAPA
jgi:tRNA (cmo5U34)-methyltransferase